MYEYILKTGGSCGRHLIKKGIPFEKGVLKNEHIALEDKDGNIKTVQTNILKKHDDGSIAWLSAAFSEHLQGEDKTYKIIESDASSAHFSGQINVSAKNDTVFLKKGEKQISARLFAEADGIREYMNICNVNTVEEGAVYKTLCLKGSFPALPILGEIYITLCSDIDRVYFEIRFTTLCDITMTAQGLEVESENEFICENEYCIKSSDGISAATKDNVRFKSKDMGNGGFVPCKNGFIFSPIQYNKPFLWLDGIARTIHMNIGFDMNIGEEIQDANEEYYSVLPWECYKKAGLIETKNISPAVKRTIDIVECYKDVVNCGFEAGHLPYQYNARCKEWSPRDVRPGETEYNLWFGYMYTGSEKLERLIRESAEGWADTSVYRGRFSEIHGANRYKTGKCYNTATSCFNQPYYGDTSGLYMSYLMTGNKYFKEMFLLCTDYICRDIERNGTLLCNIWENGVLEREMWTIGARTRFFIQLRPLWFAYELTGEQRYRLAAEKYEDWVEKAQAEKGFWYQIYDKDVKPMELYGADVPWEGAKPVKNYIMLYSCRALADYCRMSGSSRMKKVLIKFGDYLLNEISEQGYMWSPVADETLYATGEDGSRGVCPLTGCMAVTSLIDVYEFTGDTSYLKGMLSLLRYYIASLGGVCESNQLGNNRANFIRTAPRIAALLENEKETVMKLGYADIIGVFDNGAKKSERYDEFNLKSSQMSLAEYKTPIGDVIMLCYKSIWHLATYKFNAAKFTQKLSEDNCIWYGAQTVIKKDGCYADCMLKGVDCKSFVKLPIRVYTDEAVTVNVKYWDGKQAEVCLDGEARLENDNNIEVRVIKKI